MRGAGLVVGEVFAGYRIEGVLGSGGMGTVYLAAHPRLPRRVALKLLAKDLYADEEVRRRFEREADVAARLDHPHIVSVLDCGAEHGQLWISMQYVDGIDASSFAGVTLDPARALGIVTQTADALDHAHERGVLHRDVKPANILITAGREGDRVLLGDFGIARLRDDRHQLTRTGEFLATLAYASPEQLSGEPVDHRADQYALGCTLFTLLTGSAPFTATNPGAVVAAHLTNPVPNVTARVPYLPPAIDAVIARAMGKQPEQRFESCLEFAAAAKAALSDSTGFGAHTGLGGTVGLDTARERSGNGRVGPGGLPEPTGSVGLGITGPAGSTRLGADAEVGENVAHGWNSPASSSASAPARAPHTTAPAGVAPPPPTRVESAYTPPSHAMPRFPAPPPARPVGAPHVARSRQVSSGWRTFSVLLLVLAVLAVGLVGVAGVYWKFVRKPPPRSAPPWGAQHSIAVRFPQIIPSDPAGAGWRGARCSAAGTVVAQAGDPIPLKQIICTDPDGVTVWFTEYSHFNEVEAYLDAHASRVGERDFSKTGDLLLYRPTAADAPFTLATHAWIAPGLSEVLVEVSWPGHTFEQTRDEWWRQAPF
ncbi:serine/threonine-protein kinase [Nocardia bovistercoris]|uniref:non-specific serine/threonine protein kinase n=1 Tax=Nocardia bovistercoris TaxID=2785916 RepID=A0A931N1F3_9NOCA|nr:serine/threonine-protein kinase [Nocardia bovistercoris]MBH0775909.1 serine/threonine protein kinase [Nocardia bovistercoris]